MLNYASFYVEKYSSLSSTFSASGTEKVSLLKGALHFWQRFTRILIIVMNQTGFTADVGVFAATGTDEPAAIAIAGTGVQIIVVGLGSTVSGHWTPSFIEFWQTVATVTYEKNPIRRHAGLVEVPYTLRAIHL